MIFQLETIEETFYVFYLIIFVLGIQSSFYIFYRYYKIRDERLPLNKILLSIGSFYLLIILNAFIFIVIKFFISDSNLRDFFFNFENTFVFISFIVFLFFITTEDLSNWINLNLSMLIIILLSLMMIVFIIFPTLGLLELALFIGLILIGATYIAYILIRIIKNSKGIIKKRLVNIFIGYLATIISMFFILDKLIDLYPPNLFYIILFIGLSLIFAGILFTDIGVYAFPAFYEFKWEENILKLFIINQENRICLYSHDFSELSPLEQQKYFEDIFSHGIIGIESILSAISDAKDEKINKIQQADSLILLDYGSDLASKIIYALMVKKDLKSNTYFLKTIKNQFESFYKEILIEINELKGTEEQLFKSFDIILKNIIY